MGRHKQGISALQFQRDSGLRSYKHLQRYLDELTDRFDRRWRQGDLFRFVLRVAARPTAPLATA